jgi:hypothetical protein
MNDNKPIFHSSRRPPYRRLLEPASLSSSRLTQIADNCHNAKRDVIEKIANAQVRITQVRDDLNRMLIPVTFKMLKIGVDLLDREARRQGVSRQYLLREAIFKATQDAYRRRAAEYQSNI